jgi:hypothetical protein
MDRIWPNQRFGSSSLFSTSVETIGDFNTRRVQACSSFEA